MSDANENGHSEDDQAANAGVSSLKMNRDRNGKDRKQRVTAHDGRPARGTKARPQLHSTPALALSIAATLCAQSGDLLQRTRQNALTPTVQPSLGQFEVREQQWYWY